MMHHTKRLASAAALIATAATMTTSSAPVHAAVITVTTTIDVTASDGLTSLREAIQEANGVPNVNDQIVLPSGTYTLGCSTGSENVNVSGDLDIYGDTTITGPVSGSPAVITINPACGERLIEVFTNVAFSLVVENVTLRGGRETANFGSGGAVRSVGAPIVFDNTIIDDNRAGPNGSGGGIFATGSVELRNGSVVSNNSAGDGITNQKGGDGGGVALSGLSASLTITDSTVSNNTSGSGNGSGFVGRAGSGGGIYMEARHALTITGSLIDDNTLGTSGDGTEGGNAKGGGIASVNVTNEFPTEAVNITASTISNNTGGNGLVGGGGGAWIENTEVTITNSQILDNSTGQAKGGADAGPGGGLALTMASRKLTTAITMTGNTISGNTIATPETGIFASGGSGGGLFIDANGGSVTLTDNDFDGNTAGDSTGGVPGHGGNLSVDLRAASSDPANPPPPEITITGGQIRNGQSGGGIASNSTGNGGGAYIASGSKSSGGTLLIENVDITDNTTGTTTASGGGGGIHATIASTGAGTFNAGTITVDGVTARGNSTGDANTAEIGGSSGSGGGMFLSARGASSEPTVEITDSTFETNSTGNAADGTVTLGGVGGSGGGAFVQATSVSVTGSTFSSNNTGNGGDGQQNGGRGGDGGGLSVVATEIDAPITIASTTFSDNATGEGAEGATGSGGRGGQGGGLDVTALGDIIIDDVTATGNSAGDAGSGASSASVGGDGGGVALQTLGATAAVTVTASTVNDNTAGSGTDDGGSGQAGIGGDGGGIYIETAGGTATLDAVSIKRNDAGDGADATGPAGATGGFGGDGGGVYVRDLDSSGRFELIGSTVADNTAGDAGGSANDTPGVAGDGGGLFIDVGNIPIPANPGFGSGTVSIERSSVSGNAAGAGAVGSSITTAGGRGGGVFVRAGDGVGDDVTVTRSTIEGNEGGASATPSSRRGDAGGIFIDPGAAVATFEHATITNNDGLNGVNVLTRATNTTFLGTVVGEKTDRDLENCNAVGVTMTSLGHNLEASEGGFTCDFDEATDIEAESPELGSLADNGGPTLTRLPIFDSPLIDVRPCAATTDQRGVAAPFGGACDIGATESEFTPVMITTDPTRFVDTRAIGETLDDDFEGDGRRDAGSEYSVQIAGRGEVPADAVGAIMNVTAVGATDVGFVTVHPCLSTPPLASSLNHTPGVNLGNEIIAGLDASGKACFFTSASVHLTVDVVGYIPAGSPYAALAPARILETRDTPGATTIDGEFEGEGRTPNGSTFRLDVAGRAGVPDDAQAVIINLTAIGVQSNGFATVYPCGPNLPVAASLNYTVGANRGNELIAQLNDDGQLCIFTSSPIHATVDVVGHVPGGTSITPVLPQRLLDTRDSVKRTPGSQLTLQITGDPARAPGVPPGASAAIVNVTAVQPERVGFVTVHPCLPTPPNASSLNHVAAVNGGNEIIAPLSVAGEICLFTSGTTHLTVDIVGYLA